MKLLADQNVHRRVVERLRDAGYDVEWIQESMPGRLDEDILARPDIGGLALITGDKGFGRWIFNHRLGRPQAVLFSRLPHSDWATTAARVLAILERGITPGQMVVIENDGDRTRPFPTGAENG